MDLEVFPAFAVPMAQVFHPDPKQLNDELKRLILQRESMGSTHANPTPSLKQQPGVFESEFVLFSWPEPCVQELRQFCWSALGRAIQQVNGYSSAEISQLQIFSHTWFHVTRNGGFTINHIHPMASWSGVYCVAPGETPATRPESGVLRFHNPHFYSNYFLDPGNARLKRPYHHGTWNIPLQAGQLVLFPSWLQHEVLPFYGQDERITIAFNCWFSMKDGR